MKKISRRSFLGKLLPLVAIPFFPIQMLKKKSPANSSISFSNNSSAILPTGRDPELTKLCLSYFNIPLGIARRDIKDGEIIEYNPYVTTKDIIPIAFPGETDLKSMISKTNQRFNRKIRL